MTVTDHPTITTSSESSVVASVDRPRLRPVSFDLYSTIHKAIRVEMFSVVANAGRLDASDEPARVDLAVQVHDLMRFLRQHAQHEDGTIQAALYEAAPRLADQVASEHEAIEARMDHLDLLATLLRTSTVPNPRGLVHELYLDLAAFTGDYLAHQDLEERVIGQVLDEAVGVEGLMALHGAILASIPPHELTASLALMFPAMNVDDRTEMLGGMRATAPEEVFQGVWSLARSVLTSDEADVLAARLGLG